MENKENKNNIYIQVDNIPVLTLSGKISLTEKKSVRFYKCSMCGQIFDSKIQSPLDHSMLCLGY